MRAQDQVCTPDLLKRVQTSIDHLTWLTSSDPRPSAILFYLETYQNVQGLKSSQLRNIKSSFKCELKWECSRYICIAHPLLYFTTKRMSVQRSTVACHAVVVPSSHDMTSSLRTNSCSSSWLTHAGLAS